jgi:hypothetical protein
MILLTEWTQGVEVLTEQTDQGKVTYLEGPFIQTEKKNRNGRIYPKSVMEGSVDVYINDYVKQRRAIGECTHSASPSVNLKDAALIIESLSWHGDNVNGKARLLNNPNGNILKSLVEANFNMGMSTRGLGDVTSRSGTDYVNKYLLTAVDAVDAPSGQACYVNAMNESTEWVSENGIWTEKVNQHKAQQLFLEKFEELIKNIKKGK